MQHLQGNDLISYGTLDNRSLLVNVDGNGGHWYVENSFNFPSALNNSSVYLIFQKGEEKIIFQITPFNPRGLESYEKQWCSIQVTERDRKRGGETILPST